MDAIQAMPPENVGEIAAHIDYFGAANAEEVVLRLGHDLDAWRSGRKSMDEAISAPRRHRDPVITRTYASAFARTLARLEQDAPALASLGSYPERVARAPVLEAVPPVPMPMRALAAIAEALTEDAAPRVVAKPSYLIQQPEISSVSAQSKEVDETLPIPDPRFHAGRAPLPFKPGFAAEIVVSRRVRVLEPDPDAGETIVTLADGMTPISHAATPTPSELFPLAPAAPSVSLEVYAAILAELANAPASAEAVWLRRGFRREEDRRSLEKAFRARFDSEPLERKRLAELIQQYRAAFRVR